jgi:hypothetical protein
MENPSKITEAARQRYTNVPFSTARLTHELPFEKMKRKVYKIPRGKYGQECKIRTRKRGHKGGNS